MEECIQLPQPQQGGGLSVLEAVWKRKSVRDFTPEDIDRQTLSNILWVAAGRNRRRGRTAPTTHNSQEIFTYVALKEGIYRYDPDAMTLTLGVEGDCRAATGKQNFAGTAPLNLIYVADLSLIKGKEESELVQAAHCDACFMAENVYLYCASVGLGTVIRAMIDRKELSCMLGLPFGQMVTFAQSVGHIRKKEE